MKKQLSILLLLGCLVVSISSVQAQEKVNAVLRFDSAATLTVGDVVPLILEVTHPVNWRVVLPDLEAGWGQIEVRSQSTPEIINNRDSTETTSQKIEISLFAPGDYQTDPFIINVVDTNGQSSPVDVDPVSLHVTSVLIEGDTTLRDIKPPVGFTQTLANSLVPIVGAGLAVSTLATLLIIFLIRRPTKPKGDPRTPEQKALDQLDQIVDANLVQHGFAKEHYAQVSACFRAYLETTLGFPALEHTTSEIATVLSQIGITATYAFNVYSALHTCDLVVYADCDPHEQEATKLVSLVRSMILTSPFPKEATP